MQIDLKLIAEVGLALDEAEEQLTDGAAVGAEEALDRAAEGISSLREEYKTAPAESKPLLARMVKPLSERQEALRKRLPKHAAISVGTAEADSGQDLDEDPELTTA